MVIRCVVIDDEPPARDELAYLLTKVQDVEIVAMASSARTGVEAIATHGPDLVFLDIQMPGRDGFHVVRDILDLDLPQMPLFVFATAYDQYAIQAFEENAVDYLLKPFSTDRLAKSLARAREMLKARTNTETGQPLAFSSPVQEELTRLLGSLHHRSQPAVVRIPVEHNGRTRLLAPEEVVLCRSEEKKVWIHTATELFVSPSTATLDRLEERLSDLTFFRANRGALVNMEHIREFSPWTSGKYNLVMETSDGVEVTVSRGRVRAFKEYLNL